MGFFSDILFGSHDSDSSDSWGGKKKRRENEDGFPFGVSQFDIDDYQYGADSEDEFDACRDDED